MTLLIRLISLVFKIVSSISKNLFVKYSLVINILSLIIRWVLSELYSLLFIEISVKSILFIFIILVNLSFILFLCVLICSFVLDFWWHLIF